jgi:hypothetical protein
MVGEQEPGELEHADGLGAAQVVGLAERDRIAQEARQAVDHVTRPHRPLERAARADEGDDGKATQVVEEHHQLVPAAGLVDERRPRDGVAEARRAHDALCRELGLGVRRSARVGDRRRRNVDEVPDLGARGFAHHVLGASDVDALKHARIVRHDHGGQMVNAVDAVAQARERRRVAHVALPHVAPQSLDTRAQRVARQHQRAHLPAGVAHPFAEPRAHHACRAGDERDRHQ